MSNNDIISLINSSKVDQKFDEQVAVVRAQTLIKAERPSLESFVRFHPIFGKDVCLPLVTSGEEKAKYLTIQSFAPKFPKGILKAKHLFPYITRTGSIGMWDVAPLKEGKANNSYVESAHKCVVIGREKWIRLTILEERYEAVYPERDFSDPIWPDKTYEEILEQAFAGRFITDDNHPYLQRLRGLI